MEGQTFRTRLLLVCAAAPGVAAIVACAAIVMLDITGSGSSFWRGGPLTLSEAAALRDQGEVVRLIEIGNDPNAAYSLRPDVLAARSLTPLEAAVGARRAEMVYLLMTHGATIDANEWRRLHCFAVEAGAGDVVEMLDDYRPGTAVQSCTGVVTPF